MYPYLLKRKLIWRFVQLPQFMTTSWISFLYYLSVWKIFSKNSFFNQPQGVSLSIADAKVDTFILLTKHSWKFFMRFFKPKSQNADSQRPIKPRYHYGDDRFATYTLQLRENVVILQKDTHENTKSTFKEIDRAFLARYLQEKRAHILSYSSYCAPHIILLIIYRRLVQTTEQRHG